ncbi:hypothetical protein DXA01_25620 [Bacteroides caccae]|nr:hypothetical protein DXA01_25620 [Bacteroides caccae]
MKTLTWQKPGQQNVAQELIKIIINYVAELRIYKNYIKFVFKRKWQRRHSKILFPAKIGIRRKEKQSST